MLAYGVVAPHKIELPQKTKTALHKCSQRIEELGVSHLLVISSNPNEGFRVPLSYLQADIPKQNVRKLLAGAEDYSWYYNFGKEGREELARDKHSWAVVASANLSGNVGSSGARFDKTVQTAFKKLDYGALLDLDRQFLQNVGEGGLKSVLFLMGIISAVGSNEKQLKHRVLSYESSKGIGLMVSDIYVK